MTPAFAVITELKKRGYTNYLWVGHKYNQQKTKSLSPEFRTVSLQNIPFIELKTGKLIRRFEIKDILYVLNQLVLIPLGFIKSFTIIIKYNPRIILSFGGYLAVPIVIAAKLRRIPVITHEQTIVTGLANRIIGKFADKILISWETSSKYFSKEKTILTGNPIRKEILHEKTEDLTKNLDKKLPIILIYAGNQGSHTINKIIFDSLQDLLQKYNIIHQTGNSSVTNDYLTSIEIKKKLPFLIQDHYLPKDFINLDEVGEALNSADLIIGRAGANSITEYLVLGKMCILIPIPWASHNEQMKNAKLMKSTGLAEIIEEKDLNYKTLKDTITTAFKNLDKKVDFFEKPIEESKEYAKTLINLNAHNNIADIVETYLR